MKRPALRSLFRPLALAAALVSGGAGAEHLADLGPASGFSLTTQDGKALSLADLHGKVVLVSFIYLSCPDVCLTETAKMVEVQKGLGGRFGRDAYFLSVTMDPEADSGASLRRYAGRFGVKLEGWSFLTGTPEEIQRVAHAYGVAYHRGDDGELEHNTLASIVDRDGHLRVQYMGVAFDPGEMLADIQGLIEEGAGN